MSHIEEDKSESDFTFVLHCVNCDLYGEIDEYTLRYQCPRCDSEMKLSHIKKNVTGDELSSAISSLLVKKVKGDRISARIFALLADSSDPEIRNLIEKVTYEKYRIEHGITPPASMLSDVNYPVPAQAFSHEKRWYDRPHLGIGYNKSAELMDELEKRGIISAPLPGGQKREILITDGLEEKE